MKTEYKDTYTSSNLKDKVYSIIMFDKISF